MNDPEGARDVPRQRSFASPMRRAWAVWRRPPARLSAAQVQQQGLLAGFGRHALDGDDLETLLDEASAIAAAGLRVSRASILEHSIEDALFKVRSSAGWGAAAPSGLRVSAGLDSVAGHALHSGQPSVWEQSPERVAARTARLWQEHGIRSAICVPIGKGQAAAFGVIEVCSRQGRTFDEHDTAYLQSLADMLAAAIGGQRQRQAWVEELAAAAGKLRMAEEELLAKDLLTREAHHRIANSLQLLRSVLQVQARHVANPEVRDQVEGAARRVAAIGVLHRRMCEAGAAPDADAREYLTSLLDDMRAVLPDGGARALLLNMDSFALPAGELTALSLITGELVTNAIKYGHGTVTVQVRRRMGGLDVCVSDDGGGFPPDFDVATSCGLGMRLVIALARSSGGDVVAVDRSVSHGRIVVRTGFGGA